MSGPIEPNDRKVIGMGVDIAAAGSKDLCCVALHMSKEGMINLATAMTTGAAAILALNGPSDLDEKAELLNDTGSQLLLHIVGG